MLMWRNRVINGLTFKENETYKVIVKQYGFVGGFEGECHGGQWTTDGLIESAVIVEIVKNYLMNINLKRKM